MRTGRWLPSSAGRLKPLRSANDVREVLRSIGEERLDAARILRQASDEGCSWTSMSTPRRSPRLPRLRTACSRSGRLHCASIALPSSSAAGLKPLRSANEVREVRRTLGAHGPSCPLRAARLAFLVCGPPEAALFAVRCSPADRAALPSVGLAKRRVDRLGLLAFTHRLDVRDANWDGWLPGAAGGGVRSGLHPSPRSISGSWGR
jgi:hypothetical protein